MILNKTEVCLLVIGPTIPSSERCYLFIYLFFNDSLNTEKFKHHICVYSSYGALYSYKSNIKYAQVIE